MQQIQKIQNRQMAQILQNPFLKSGLVDSQRVSCNIETIKDVELAIKGVLN
jgi:hypothetical protein